MVKYRYPLGSWLFDWTAKGKKIYSKFKVYSKVNYKWWIILISLEELNNVSIMYLCYLGYEMINIVDLYFKKWII